MPALVYISALLACYKPCRDQETGTLSSKPYNMIMVALAYLLFVTWVQQVVLQRGAYPAPSESRYWLPRSIFLSITWPSRLPYPVTWWEGKKSRRWRQRQNNSELLSSSGRQRWLMSSLGSCMLRQNCGELSEGPQKISPGLPHCCTEFCFCFQVAHVWGGIWI